MATQARVEPALLVAAPLAIEALALACSGPGARVVRTGMGPARARAAAERLAGTPARAVAVLGVAGATTPDLRPGTLVVADTLLDPSGASLALDPSGPLAALAAAGIGARVGAIACVERLSLAARSDLADRAGAVDMESVWLAPGAAGRPFAVVRAITDGPGHALLRPDIVARGVLALARLRAAVAPLVAWAAAPALAAPPGAAALGRARS